MFHDTKWDRKIKLVQAKEFVKWNESIPRNFLTEKFQFWWKIFKNPIRYSKICFFYKNCDCKKVADFIRNKKLLQFFALQIICKIQSLLSLGPHMKTIYLYSNLHFFPYSPMFPCSDRLFWIFTGNFLCIYDYILVLTYMVFHMDKMDLKNELNY